MSRAETVTETPIALPIREVTVLEDRAHIRRMGTVQVPSGRSRLTLEIAPIVSDKTVTGRFLGGEGARVLDARVRRNPVILEAEKTPDERGLDARILALEGEQEKRRRALDRGENHREQLSTWLKVALREAGDDARWGRLDPERVERLLSDIAQREALIDDSQVKLRASVQTAERTLQDLLRLQAAGETPNTSVRALAVLDVETEGASEVELGLEYVVPGACWRPYHTARWLDAEVSAVELSTDACVWQRTGEDWSDVELSFSTERRALGSAPPPLFTDLVYATGKAPTDVVEVREQRIQTTGLASPTAAQITELPGIDDGGVPRILAAPRKVTVPSDGQPYRIDLGRFQSPLESRLVLMPELVGAAVLKSEQTNESENPLLPGPVDLIKNGGIIGRTSVEYVAPRQRFEIGWGPEGSLRVSRKMVEKAEDTGLLSSWRRTARKVEVLISNIGRVTRTVEVVERVLVSEIERVKVVFREEETTDRRRPDRDGFVRWSIEVPANATAELHLGYAIETHPNVVGLF